MSVQRFSAVAFLISTALFLLLSIRFFRQPVDTLYVNGTLYTMDAAMSTAEAMGVRGDRIVAVGSRADLERELIPETIVDLGGRAVLPGLIDAHVHLMGLALSKITVDLTGSLSERDAAGRVSDRVRICAAGQWVRGRGWDQNDWPSKRFPARAVLDGVAPDNPVYLVRVDGHAAWVNSRALELAGIGISTPDPAGGKIVRDQRGVPTGVLVDAAMDLVSARLPRLSSDEAAEALQLAAAECIGLGITTVHDMGIEGWELDLYKKQIDNGSLKLRICAAVGAGTDLWESMKASGPLLGYGNRRLTVRAVKLYMDGALGSRGAAMLEPYTDDPGNRGLTMASSEEMDSLLQEAFSLGFQPCVHAIGDRANKLVLDAYERALSGRSSADLRPRIEHAQVLAPADIPRFRVLGVVPSMQPTHCTSDMYWAEARLGPERVKGAYAWRSLLSTGVVIPGGSDFPVESANPFFGIYAAVTRRDHAGFPRTAQDVAESFQLSPSGVVAPEELEGGWYVHECVSRREALRMFTTWAARAGFEENCKGSLERGKLADFIVLSDDILQLSEDKLFETSVVLSVIGGEEVFSRLND